MKLLQTLVAFSMVTVEIQGGTSTPTLYEDITVKNLAIGCMEPEKRDSNPGYLVKLQVCGGSDIQKFNISVKENNLFMIQKYLKKEVNDAELVNHCAYLRQKNIFKPQGRLRMEPCDRVEGSNFFSDFLYDENPHSSTDKTITPQDGHQVHYCLTARGLDQNAGEPIIAKNCGGYGDFVTNRPRYSWEFGPDGSATATNLLTDLAN